MALPQARVVKQGGQLYAPPPRPASPPWQWRTGLRDAAAVMVGLWPITAVMLFVLALLISAANWSAP